MTYPYRLHDETAEGLLPHPAAAGDGLLYFQTLTRPLAELDGNASSIYAGRVDLEQAKGVVLDLIGDTFNEPRGGLEDHEYRRLIAGRRVAWAGAVTPPRVWAGWVALTDLRSGRLRNLGSASIQLEARVDWIPSSLFLDRAGRVVDALVGAGWEASALMAPPGTAHFNEHPGFTVGTFAYQLRTGRTS